MIHDGAKALVPWGKGRLQARVRMLWGAVLPCLPPTCPPKPAQKLRSPGGNWITG